MLRHYNEIEKETFVAANYFISANDKVSKIVLNCNRNCLLAKSSGGMNQHLLRTTDRIEKANSE
jgi:hypothetical protein